MKQLVTFLDILRNRTSHIFLSSRDHASDWVSYKISLSLSAVYEQ